MTRDDVQSWLDRYVEAWRSNDERDVGALFSENAEYRYHPWDEPLIGREAVVADWLTPDNRDEPDTWEARYEPFAIDGDRAVATGWSRYFASGDAAEKMYHNVYLLEFDDDGRCRSFTELFMQEPEAAAKA